MGKLYDVYGLGNAMSFPMSVGASTVLLPKRPTPQIVNEILIENKATLDLQDKDKWTALMYATYYGHTDIVKLLIKNGAKIIISHTNSTNP